MIFIHTRIVDETTVSVIQWLCNQKKDFFRLNNANDIMNSLIWDMKEGKIMFKDIQSKQMLNAADCNSFYFNNGYLDFFYQETNDSLLNAQISENISNESRAFFDYFYNNALKKKQFGNYGYTALNTNKLYVLEMAQKAGFDIPSTAIVSTKSELLNFLKKWGKVITKNIDYGIEIRTNHILISGQRTQEVTLEIVERMEEQFGLSLIQQLIEKQFEIRVFYFNGIVFSIALFSQGNVSSKIDSRYRDKQNPNREIPFTLPRHLEERICVLMRNLELNYGSIDLIYTPQQTFIFLEVNPYGQYGFLSRAGNYYIEKEIAEYL